MSKLPNFVHPWFLSLVILTFILFKPEKFILLLFLFFNLPAPAAARSLAIPLTPRQSALFGVIERSTTFWFLLMKYFFPTCLLYFVGERVIIPSLSFDNFSSDSEQSIP